MPEVVGVRFKPCGKIYDFEVDGIDIQSGDKVVVESELGLYIGNIVKDRHSVGGEERKLQKIIRKATEEDLRQQEENKNLEEEAKENCIERIMARGLPMKLISTEATLDRKRIIFYFTADKRIDFRELVKDLAAKFRTRIEMRQIGVRDSAKIIGSLGICGRELCCKRFLTTFEPISIKMAKKQELVLNTGKLSGACGRLMCCLGFEYTNEYQGWAKQTDEENPPGLQEQTETEVAISSGNQKMEIHQEIQIQVQVQPPPVSQPAEQETPSDEQERKKKRKKWPMRRRKKKQHHKKFHKKPPEK